MSNRASSIPVLGPTPVCSFPPALHPPNKYELASSWQNANPNPARSAIIFMEVSFFVLLATAMPSVEG